MEVRRLTGRALVSLVVGVSTLWIADRAIGAVYGPVVKPVNALGLTTGLNEVGTHLRPGFQGRYQNAEFAIDIAINSSGLRGPEIGTPKAPGTYRVLALGDSFTFGQGVQFADAWPHLVQEKAPATVEIVNGGWSAGSPVGYLRYLRSHGFALDPDLVLVAMFVGNDVVEDMAERNAGPRPIDRLEYESRYVTALQIRVGLVGRLRELLDTSFPNLYELATLAVVKGQYLFGSHRTHFDYVLADEETAELRDGWLDTLTTLGEMASAVEARGAKFAVMIVPFYDQVAPTAYGTGYTKDRPQQRIVAYCRTRGLSCLDLLPALRAVAGAESLYYLKDGHWTARGHRVAADAIADRMFETGSLPHE